MKNKEQLKELRQKSSKLLFSELAKEKEKLADLKRKFAVKKLNSSAKLRDQRKKIARIYTILYEKELQEMKEEKK